MEEIQPTLDSFDDYEVLLDKLTGHGAPRSRTSEYPSGGDTYCVTFEYYDPSEESVGEQENNAEVSLLFAVDWDKMELVLRDRRLPLAPTPSEWTNVEEWLIGPADWLCLARFIEAPNCCFLVESE